MRVRNHSAIVSRTDLFMVDPREIKIVEGWNPRVDFSDQEDMNRDVAQNGVKDPVRLKLLKNGDLCLIDGERRLRAALSAIDSGIDIKAIPARIAQQNISDINALTDAIISNHSKPFLPMEEAVAYKRLFDWGQKISDIADSLGRTVEHVRQRLSLLEGCPEIQKAINEKKIPMYLAKNIIEESEGSIKKQKELLKKTQEQRKSNKDSVSGSKKKPKRESGIEETTSEEKNPLDLLYALLEYINIVRVGESFTGVGILVDKIDDIISLLEK